MTYIEPAIILANRDIFRLIAIKYRIFWLILGILILGAESQAGCSPEDNPVPELLSSSNPDPKEQIEISFTLNYTEGVIPSYQTVIWLESPDNLIHTLLVSEWLCYSGYSDERICPDWSRRSNWSEMNLDEMDAVSAATPRRRSNTFRFDCNEARLSPGTYHYFVQTHIEDDYNILASGTIIIGEEYDESPAQFRHDPEKHPLASTALTDVSVKYYPD